MQFRYKGYEEFGVAKRPVIQVVLRNPHGSTAPGIGYEALVDSGSDRPISMSHRCLELPTLRNIKSFTDLHHS